jgi:hypothetical protein
VLPSNGLDTLSTCDELPELPFHLTVMLTPRLARAPFMAQKPMVLWLFSWIPTRNER